MAARRRRPGKPAGFDYSVFEQADLERLVGLVGTRAVAWLERAQIHPDTIARALSKRPMHGVDYWTRVVEQFHALPEGEKEHSSDVEFLCYARVLEGEKESALELLGIARERLNSGQPLGAWLRRYLVDAIDRILQGEDSTKALSLTTPRSKRFALTPAILPKFKRAASRAGRRSAEKRSAKSSARNQGIQRIVTRWQARHPHRTKRENLRDLANRASRNMAPWKDAGISPLPKTPAALAAAMRRAQFRL